MQQADLNGATLEYAVQGSGEPLLLIHGAILADAFVPLQLEPSIGGRYRVNHLPPAWLRRQHSRPISIHHCRAGR
jgi:hypothetical protein